MQRIVADFAELEHFEWQAKQVIDEIERQLADLAGFLALLHEQWTLHRPRIEDCPGSWSALPTSSGSSWWVHRGTRP